MEEMVLATSAFKLPTIQIDPSLIRLVGGNEKSLFKLDDNENPRLSPDDVRVRASWPYSWVPDGEKIVFAGARDGI